MLDFMSSCYIFLLPHSNYILLTNYHGFIKTTAELLGCKPDIACFAKLMTGGMVPLAVTLATDAVFDSFSGDSKVKTESHRLLLIKIIFMHF